MVSNFRDSSDECCGRPYRISLAPLFELFSKHAPHFSLIKLRQLATVRCDSVTYIPQHAFTYSFLLWTYARFATFHHCVYFWLPYLQLLGGGSALIAVVEYLGLVYSMSHQAQYLLRSGYQTELIVVEPWLLASPEVKRDDEWEEGRISKDI
jgi:hypothetical protein